MLWTKTCLKNEPGGRSKCTAGCWKETSLGTRGGEGKRREGGSLGRNCDGEGHCSEGQILGNLKGQRNVKIGQLEEE